MNNKIIMQVNNIRKNFNNVVALNNVNFDVMEGEILAIVGENGAGKSTLMQIITGVYPYGSYEGYILIDDKKMKCKNTKSSEKLGIGMIYQEISSHLDMNVTENIFMGDWEKNKFGFINWKKLYAHTKELLEKVNIYDIEPTQKMRTLSKAQQQMVAISCALRKMPRILIMDEATSTLPQKEVDLLFDVIRKLKNNGITVILITHKMDEVFTIADRIAVLRNGETVNCHMVKDVKLDTVIEEMVGRSLSAMYPKETVDIGQEILRVENLTVRHPFNNKKNIVENISFTLHAGEILGLEGLVGSGRTEILNAIYGLGNIVSGKIFINGKEILSKNINTKNSLSNGLALITEDRREDGFIAMMSIRKNITLSSLKSINRYGFILRKKESKSSNFYFDKLRIKAPDINTNVGNLSGGNQQKVVISKCLLTNPKILFMGDPTRGIDVGAKSEIYKIMVEQAKMGMGIIVASSERTELIEMTDRMIVLSGGKIQKELQREDYNEKEIVDLSAR